jgi:two-component system, LuxR family, response regulator FixJ
VRASAPTVVVIDDDEAVRNALLLLFRSIELPVQVFAAAQDYLAQYADAQSGCLVVDVRMPGMSGLELQQELTLRGAMVPVIFITGHGDIAMAVQAMQRGAFDFLAKPFRDQDLIDRVRRALQQDAAHRLEFDDHARIRERLESLTRREREVLALVTSGKANKAMAAELGLSQRTIEIHRARVMQKMQAGSLAQLVRMCLELARDGGVPQMR